MEKVAFSLSLEGKVRVFRRNTPAVHVCARMAAPAVHVCARMAARPLVLLAQSGDAQCDLCADRGWSRCALPRKLVFLNVLLPGPFE